MVLEGTFELPIYIDLGATLLFGLTGALAGMKRGYDWVGIFALGFTTAVGGGVIRDGILISQGPPAVTRDSRYILAVLLAVGLAFVFRHQIHRFNKVIAVLDALGLGAYGVVGVQKALNAELSPAAAVLVGVVNAAGGGVLRDVLVRDEPLIFKPGQFYALAALAGCVLFAVLTLQFHMKAGVAALITIAVTFAFRMLAIYYNWQTRPVWDVPAPPPPPAQG